jgi:aspartyl-tRNA(Asn)/glutamyl-tRNA(Gln) amidotransferase subunit C
MNINVDKLASLAQLQFDDATKKQMTHDLQNILNFVNELSKVDTTHVLPLIYMNEDHSITRPDLVQGELPQTQAISNAPLQNPPYFAVPKVM